MEAFIRALPDERAARTFLSRLESLDPNPLASRPLDQLLLSRLLTLAAYSPFLAEIILRHPEYIDWLKRETERDLDRAKSTEQLSEDLARFLARAMDTNRQSSFARFKQREMLRIYLRDCLAIASLAEVTEELSNLADLILKAALAIAQQEMVNLHGAPLARDERGRIAQAEFAIVALGKLGCRELNYASDIDLLFMYAGAGETAGDHRRPGLIISNKEFFTGVANRVIQMIGSNTGEGAVYRVDLRLRPYGRDGDLVWEIERAADYYRAKAQNWERQALIRARAAAGSEPLITRFLDLVRDVIFSREALPDTIAGVRRAKEKIDRKSAARTGGYNVKLGRGGIREIEFIAQALQLEYGGREPWVRSTQTLIVLARLAEKQYLSEGECALLSAAYTFLRTIEHRLQMEQGVQTHTLPIASERLELVARRSGYLTAHDAAAQFTADLQAHTSAVRAVYNRVFAEGREADKRAAATASREGEAELDDETERFIKQASNALRKMITAHGNPDPRGPRVSGGPADEMEQVITSALPSAINPLRSLRNLIAWAESLSTYNREQTRSINRIIAERRLPELIKRIIETLSSQYLFHILVSRPVLAALLIENEAVHTATDFLRLMREAIDKETSIASKSDALRRTWYRLVVETGYRDMAGVHRVDSPEASILESETASPANILRLNNLEQTALAETALQLAVEIALASFGISQRNEPHLPFAILALGRLGHSGMDYGSDLDLLVVYDESPRRTPAGIDPASGFATAQEFYAKLTAQIVRVLSSVTREGFVYRIDLRLRPDGQSGPLAQGLGSLLSYISERASAWEHSAYLKAREVAGDLSFGARTRKAICEACFDRAAKNASLKEDLAAMRARLEKEKTRAGRPNIKWGSGAMSDVYFITRYLQLRDRIYFPTEQGTTALILHLGERGSLDEASTRALFEGYSFLRRLDHWMRLLLDRPGPALPASQVALRDIAHALGLYRVEDFERHYSRHTSAIRQVYETVFK